MGQWVPYSHCSHPISQACLSVRVDVLVKVRVVIDVPILIHRLIKYQMQRQQVFQTSRKKMSPPKEVLLYIIIVPALITFVVAGGMWIVGF